VNIILHKVVSTAEFVVVVVTDTVAADSSPIHLMQCSIMGRFSVVTLVSI